MKYIKDYDNYKSDIDTLILNLKTKRSNISKKMSELSKSLKGSNIKPWDTIEGKELISIRDKITKDIKGLINAQTRKQVSIYKDIKFKKKVRSIILPRISPSKLKSVTLELLYPKKLYPKLWNDSMINSNNVDLTIFFNTPNILHTIWRGIHYKELEFIRLNKFIQSNQSMNIGYEVDKNMTVYSFTPSSAINYASNFIEKNKKPSKNKPNYLIEVEIDDESIMVDSNDEYVKSLAPINSNKIRRVFEVYDNNKIGKEINL